jgi:predicted helicase
MSFDAIHNYYREVENLKHRGGTINESSLRTAFQKLLDTYAKSKDLKLVAEVGVVGKRNKVVYPDGTLKDNLRQDWGYWESKDEADDLDLEVQKKFAKGYPDDNILFEDGKNAVLYRNGNLECRAVFKDEVALDKILRSFTSYQRPEVAEFRKAIERFKHDIPDVTEALREMIMTKAEQKSQYISKMNAFLTLCKEVINPNITKEDIREMVIQHILTADIFNTIFDEPHFHRENNIARELNALTETFFTREVRNSTLAGIKHYYDTINAKAAQIADHHEKQMFLKVVYETFYKSYDPKKADRLGVVYTPNEIVRFMIESTDYLLGKHFGKQLEDKNVEILDPATGTGTFICDLIDHISKDKLPYKYKHELHANEVEILPYYIANLNIEFTYKQKTGEYAEFENLCFVDTLDNMGFDYKDKQDDIFSVSDENADRIKRQNEKKISVIIGNPPYNANQMNENENNKNREYPVIDKRIKDTYIKYSTAQKTKLYDMYARFLRWASDRIDENGVIAFVSNSSFINSRTYDGFRKVIKDEFNYLYMIDLKGNARNSGERRRQEGGNIFHDQIKVGIAVYFLIKVKGETGFTAYYSAVRDYAKAEEKLDYLSQNTFKKMSFEHIQPDKDNNWLHITDNDWDDMVAVADKTLKGNQNKTGAIFDLFSNGIVTARDEWTYDFSSEALKKKAQFFCDLFKTETERWNKSDKQTKVNDFVDRTIKWTEELERYLEKQSKLIFTNDKIRKSLYRPYTMQNTYYDRIITHRVYQQDNICPIRNSNLKNVVIAFSGEASSKPFSALVTDTVYSYDLLEKTQCLPLYRYDSDGNRHDNITDWAWGEFKAQYKDESITKEDIFHYVYGVLHNPAYRVKYEQNLKRSLPRIPYYEDFGKWAVWGKALMDLHLNYETVVPYPLEREDTLDDYNILALPTDLLHYFAEHPEITSKEEKLKVYTMFAEKHAKPKLKADKENGKIIIDNITTLKDIPNEAWSYKLGNRSALEWILDQYKEKKPKDPTIAKLFNTYKFADYKDQVIDLLLRVTTVSVETMKIVREMEN